MDGCRELVLGNEDKALKYLKDAVHLADGAYLAGFLTLKKEQLTEAADYLSTAAEKHSRLGRYFSKYEKFNANRIAGRDKQLSDFDKAVKQIENSERKPN